MKEDRIDGLLKQLSHQPIPAMPKNLEQNIWREIRLRKEETPSPSFFEWIFELWATPRLAFASIAVAVVIGISIGFFENEAPSRAATTARALELQVFSSSALGLRPVLSADNT